MDNKYDVIVVGAGFAGATIANRLANANKKVLIIEKRNHIGGNAYDYYNENGVLVHKYGPHIFHTSIKRVFDYLNSFVEFEKYEHKVLGNIDGTLVPIPFNFTALERLFGSQANDIENKLLNRYPNQSRISVLDLMNDDDKAIKDFGKYVYEKVFAFYTAKQWRIKIEDVDKSVINRVPVVIGYEDLYFSDSYQFMPKNGFSDIFNKMLDSPNIDIILGTSANSILTLKNDKVYYNNQEFKGKVVYTGALDELFNYQYGILPYRSLRLKFEDHDITWYQPASVVNYTTSEKFTRITEFKYLSNQDIPNRTTILKEYPLSYTEKNYQKATPYYPIQNEENIQKYLRYKDLLSNYKNIYLCGRLAEYEYYNMDKVIDKALDVAQKIIDELDR